MPSGATGAESAVALLPDVDGALRSRCPSSQHVLICDDEHEVVDVVSHLLEAEGYRTCGCFSAEEAMARLRERTFDLAILDVMMPGRSGFELLRHMRGSADVCLADMPVILLTAKVEEFDKVLGFTLGADDYVTKPFKPRELVMRVRARLRRKVTAVAPPDMLAARGIELREATHEASLHGEPLSLTPTEFSCLAELLRAKGTPLSAHDLFEAVWKVPYSASSHNTVMVYIRRLRKKLAAIDSSEEFIETVWGIGYRIAAGEAHA